MEKQPQRAAASEPPSMPPPPPPPSVSRPIWLRLAAGILVILIVAVTIGLWYATTKGPVREIETLATGEQLLILPLMTYYSLPALGPRGTSETSVTWFNTTSVDFVWGNTSGAGLPVRFVLRPNESFEAGPADGFRFRPVVGGPNESFGVFQGNREVVYTKHCVLNYTIKRMAQTVGFGSESWIQVEYSLSSNVTEFADLPFAGVTSPSASDLLFVMNETVTLVAPWEYRLSLDNFAKPVTPFHYTVGQLMFSLGATANLTADLTSSFAWGPNDRYDIFLSGRRDGTLNVTWYWDMRFGSLLAVP